MTLVLDTEKCSGSTWVLSRMYTSYQLHHCQRCLWGLKVGLTSNSWQFQLESWWILALDGFPWLSQLRIPFLSLMTDVFGSLSTSFFGTWNQCNSHQFTWLRRWSPNECLVFLPGSGSDFFDAQNLTGCHICLVSWTSPGETTGPGDVLLPWGIEQDEHPYLVGGFNHGFYFPFHILYGMSSFPLTNSIIFQHGYCTTNQLRFSGQLPANESKSSPAMSCNCAESTAVSWLRFPWGISNLLLVYNGTSYLTYFEWMIWEYPHFRTPLDAE